MLVADDDRHLKLFLVRAFSRLNLPVNPHFVRDGEEAIDYLRGQARFTDRAAYPLPKLLLLDLKMPKIDGFEVLLWLRGNPSLKRLICLIFTNSDQPADINRAYDLGANGYVRKPTSLVQFYGVVEEIHRYWATINLPPECSRPDL